MNFRTSRSHLNTDHVSPKNVVHRNLLLRRLRVRETAREQGVVADVQQIRVSITANLHRLSPHPRRCDVRRRETKTIQHLASLRLKCLRLLQLLLPRLAQLLLEELGGLQALRQGLSIDYVLQVPRSSQVWP